MERAIAKYAGATAMYFVAKKLKKKYNIIDERKALYESAETWVDALKGGPKPNLADLAVFGVLRPIRRLRSGKDMVNHTRIGEWYARKEKAVGESSRIKEQQVVLLGVAVDACLFLQMDYNNSHRLQKMNCFELFLNFYRGFELEVSGCLDS
ncbi:hypothetical protein Dimus_016225 [Dionaea muscipula]